MGAHVFPDVSVCAAWVPVQSGRDTQANSSDVSGLLELRTRFAPVSFFSSDHMQGAAGGIPKPRRLISDSLCTGSPDSNGTDTNLP